MSYYNSLSYIISVFGILKQNISKAVISANNKMFNIMIQWQTDNGRRAGEHVSWTGKEIAIRGL
jgi:hypothetical protein